MTGILADADVVGHVRLLVAHFQNEIWREIWTEINCHVFTLADLGLAASVPDSLIWHTCQQRRIVLITGNRNRKGPDSLEATIRLHNQLDSLPVLTLADAGRVLTDRTYAERAAEKVLERLLEIENYKGSGRIFVP
jgi:hypothetical protein